MSQSWRIVFMGTPATAASTLEQLLNGPDPVVGVVTQPDRPAGRGQKSLPSPVRRLAERHGIPVVAPEKIRNPDLLSQLKGWNPQIIAVVAYGRLLPSSILDLAPQGCVNVHYSLLPKYRGAAPVAWAIINGEQTSGVTTMKLVEKMDAGPIFLQEKIALDPEETAASLQLKLTPIGGKLLLETFHELKEGVLTPREQAEAEATFAPLLKKDDGRIDWNQRAVVIERRVRGLNPWPSAYTHAKGKLLKIHSAKVIAADEQRPPGEIIKADSEGFWVATGRGIVGLEEVQLEGKRKLPGTEFVKGARIEAGDRL